MAHLFIVVAEHVNYTNPSSVACTNPWWYLQGNVFVNQYLVIKDLGRGAHGTVKLVFDTEEQVVYAMKVGGAGIL